MKEILFVAFHLFVSGPLGVWKEKRREGRKRGKEGRRVLLEAESIWSLDQPPPRRNPHWGEEKWLDVLSVFVLSQSSVIFPFWSIFFFDSFSFDFAGLGKLVQMFVELFYVTLHIR